MPSRDRYKTYYKGAFYHIFNRGNQKQNIFLEDQDFSIYLRRLRRYKEEYCVSLLVYILMPNHLHLLVRQNTSVPIYKFISPLHTSYSIYFNKKYERIGHLFQGRYKQRVIRREEDLLHLSRYIHINAVEAGLAGKPEDYVWSSYPDYIDKRGGTLVDKSFVLGILGDSPQRYREFVEAEISGDDFEKIRAFVIEQ